MDHRADSDEFLRLLTWAVNSEFAQVLNELFKYFALLAAVIVLFIFRTPLGTLICRIRGVRYTHPGGGLDIQAEALEVAVTALETEKTTVSPPEDDSEEAMDSLENAPEAQPQRVQMYIAYEEKDFEKGDDIFQRLQASENVPLARHQNEVIRAFHRYKRGDGDAFAELERISKIDGLEAYALRYKALAFENYGQLRQAYAIYKECEKLSNDIRLVASAVEGKLRCLPDLDEITELEEDVAAILEG